MKELLSRYGTGPNGTGRNRTGRRPPNSKTGGCRFKSCRACQSRAIRRGFVMPDRTRHGPRVTRTSCSSPAGPVANAARLRAASCLRASVRRYSGSGGRESEFQTSTAMSQEPSAVRRTITTYLPTSVRGSEAPGRVPFPEKVSDATPPAGPSARATPGSAVPASTSASRVRH